LSVVCERAGNGNESDFIKRLTENGTGRREMGKICEQKGEESKEKDEKENIKNPKRKGNVAK
jgi:hypothetical protein